MERYRTVTASILLIIGLMMGTSCSDSSYKPEGHHAPPLLIAHRGASELAPENTIPAVEKAWELGADAVEVDVRLTKDDRIVAIHDRSTGRTSNRKMMVRKTTYDRLAELDAGAWFDPRFEGTRIPLLSEVMDHVPADKELVIEIKSEPRTVELFEAMLDDRRAIPAFSIISFDAEVVKEAKDRFPEIPVYWVIRRAGNLGQKLNRAKRMGINGLNIDHLNFSNGKRVERIRDKGLHVLCWTVNDTARAKKLHDMGVEGLTTDRPQKIREALGL